MLNLLLKQRANGRLKAMDGRFFCGACGRLLYESHGPDMPFVAAEHLPCANCGCSSIRAELLEQETITHSASMSARVRDGLGKLFLKLKSGPSRSKDGTYAAVEQLVDK